MDQEINIRFDLKQKIHENIESNDKVKQKLQNRKNSNLNDDLFCNICNTKLCNKKSLRLHMAAKHLLNSKLKFFACDFCGMSFYEKSNLIAHFKLRHKEGKTSNFICNFDGKIFGTKQKLLGHMVYHRVMEKCKICGKVIKYLTIHMKQVHSKEGQKIKCQICDTKLKNIQNLKIHLQTHKKKFQCLKCGRKFSRFGTLKEHLKYHDGEFRCEICQKIFSQKGTLNKHLKTHNKDRPKPFECQKCDYSTDIKHNLTAHLKTHDENREKSLKCNQCDYKTDQKTNLKTHFQIHNPNRVKFPCLYCSYEATVKCSLTKHLKRKHNTN